MAVVIMFKGWAFTSTRTWDVKRLKPLMRDMIITNDAATVGLASLFNCFVAVVTNMRFQGLLPWQCLYGIMTLALKNMQFAV